MPVPAQALAALAIALPALALPLAHAAPFTYQGRLDQTGVPANGTFDIVVELHSASAGGTPLATDSFEDIQVTGGLFTLPIDFGPGFPNADARWLDIRVRPGASTGGFQTLPRQFIDAAPFASIDLNEPWTVTPGAQARARFGDGNDIVLINRSNRIGSEFFGIGAETSSFGGMYIDTNADGEPFYGYSTGGIIQAYHYFDTVTDALRLFLDGDRLAIDSTGVRVNGGISATGRLTLDPDAPFPLLNADPAQNRVTLGGGIFGGGTREVDLSVFGQVSAITVSATEFTYAQGQFRTLAIPASAFQPTNTASGYNVNLANGAIYSTTPGSPVSFITPVYLPSGAEITDVRVFLRNATGVAFFIELELQVPGSDSDTLASAGSNFVAPLVSITVLPNPPVPVDNEAGALTLRVGVTAPGWSGSSGTSILGARVRYVVTSAD